MKMFCERCNEDVEVEHVWLFEDSAFNCSICGHELDYTEIVDTSLLSDAIAFEDGDDIPF